MAVFKAIMIGDVVGEGGLTALESGLTALIQKTAADFVVVNGENAAEGFGMTERELKRILDAGADVITTGNHIWEKRDFWPFLDKEERLLRPANYPGGTAGHGWFQTKKNNVSWGVVNLQGREFMTPIDCPFKSFDTIADKLDGALILVDFHAESTREKEALAYYLDGRISVMAGTHTHVQTGDERILPQGAAYITDLGMTGVTGGIIGMDPKICLDRARTQVLYRMEVMKPAPGEVPLIKGIAVEIDGDTGKALSITRLSPNNHPG
ncbi:MAG: YmdB family metallophosphoesterase [Treponema sp.]|jgi:metallophosphoesterase (TIGR00282 family)|nr:YmdB family metallophosphoesterase [Treponema sp.]